ncbi:type I methionyl aminopeptidase [Chloroflexota bacterium]
MSIFIKSGREIDAMRQAGNIVAQVLDILVKHVKPGMKTIELDTIAGEEIKKRGAIPSFKGYRGYPANLCVSINDEIVHGIPGERTLKDGDIVSLDIGAIFKGFHGDAAITVASGEISSQAKMLIDDTRGALMAGIGAARYKARLGDISAAIQDYVESRGLSVVREYTGHGIGREMHEDPQILNFGLRGTGVVLKKGMTLALEPMVNIGDWHTKVDSDNWTVRTADGSLSAHFEHDIAITDGEADILTVL